MQFGADPRLAEQCVPLPPPEGYRPWVTGVDGPLSPDWRALAERFAAEEPIGAVMVYQTSPRSSILIRSEPQIWQENADGSISRGCFQVGAIYVPSTAAEKVIAPAEGRGLSKLDITVGVLTIASLAVGTAATIATWKRRR